MFGLFGKKKIKRNIIINAESLETRVAVLENGKLEEFQVEHPTEQRLVGNIYKGVIQNLEHDLQAAFVNIGMKKNAFLHYWDMMPDGNAGVDLISKRQRRGRRSKKKRFNNADVSRRFPPGSEIVVQVTKDAIGTKGPRVSANLSIPGKYLVMMPGSKLKGVSKKIDDGKERQRLKKIFSRLPIPEGIGLIMRTAASGASKRSIARDLRGMVSIWTELTQGIADKKAPACLYTELDLTARVVRDWLVESIDKIIIDSKEHYDNIRNIAAKISRSARSRIHLYDGNVPVFSHYDVDRQIEEAFRRSVMLSCGGYIIFDETEALIAVDVNTGKYKGKGSQAEAILVVNTEAVEEVARQLRLRNVGGLVVLDLIDMKSRKHQNAVYRAMKKALRRDKARTNVLQISDLGLMEMTRQRVEESLLSSMYVDCPYCKGRGSVLSSLSMSVEIQRQISAIVGNDKTNFTDLQIVIHPKVLERLKSEDEQFLLDMESEFGTKLTFKSDPSKHIEYFAINDLTSGVILYSKTKNDNS